MYFVFLANTSILSYYKDVFGGTKILPWSLEAEMTWNKSRHVWNINVHGKS